MLLTTHPLLVLWSWKSRAIPLPTLWTTIGPVTGSLYLYLLIVLEVLVVVVVVVSVVVTTVFIFSFDRTCNFITHMLLDTVSEYSIFISPLMLTSKYNFLQNVGFL